MTLKEVKHLCDMLAYSERAMESLSNHTADCDDYYNDIIQCVETLEQARMAILNLLDTIKVF